MFGVGELGERLVIELGRFVSGVGHRSAHIDGECGAEIGFLDVLAHHVAVAAGDDTPIERARIIAGRVRSVFGELDGHALVRAGVLAC